MQRSPSRSQARAEACEALIVRCLRDILRDRVRLTTIGALSEDALALLADVSAHHRVAPAVRCALRPGQLPAAVEHRMAGLERGARLRHLIAVADLAWLDSSLRAHAGDWVVFKGPILSQVVYQRPDLRSYADIDVLVRPSAFEHVLDDLTVGGAELLDVNWGLIRRSRRAELSLRLPAGNLLDLHWHVVNHAEDRAVFHISTDDLLGRQRLVDVAPLRLPTFDAVDTVLHLALHSSMDGGHRLVWMLDLAQAMRHVTDWNELVARAEHRRISLPVGLMLRRTITTLQPSDAPHESVRRLLAGHSWSKVVATAERLRPPLSSFWPRRPSLRVATSSTRSDASASVRELVRRGVRELADPSHPWRSGHASPRTDPNRLRQPAGAPCDRREYLTSVRCEEPERGPRGSADA